MYSYMTDLSVYFTRAHSYFGAKLMSFDFILRGVRGISLHFVRRLKQKYEFVG